MTARPRKPFQHDPSVADFAVPKSAYLSAHPEAPSLIATSALVLHKPSSTSEPRILLLQRAASDSNPNKWEPPGGAVDDSDASILYGAARELWEETGLLAARVSGVVGEPHFFARSNGDRVGRFNFAVFVENENDAVLAVKLDDKEHQNFVWATAQEVREGRVGEIEVQFVREEVRRTVLLAFEHARKG